MRWSRFECGVKFGHSQNAVTVAVQARSEGGHGLPELALRHGRHHRLSAVMSHLCIRSRGAAHHLVERAEFGLIQFGSVRRAQGVPESLASCHTALVGGYVLEGHVPAEDVRRLLAERPEAVGLVVPGMPLGSPGMETPDGQREVYETLLILKGGGTRVFARHGQARRVA